MKINSTSNNDKNRLAFIENLYKELRLQTKCAMEERNNMVVKAGLYLDDGASEEECAELLIIDGLSRETAESYVCMAQQHLFENAEDQSEYSFQFKDNYGKLWSSYDLNKTIYASSNEEAWLKAEEMIFSDPSIEPERIVSIDRI